MTRIEEFLSKLVDIPEYSPEIIDQLILLTEKNLEIFRDLLVLAKKQYMDSKQTYTRALNAKAKELMESGECSKNNINPTAKRLCVEEYQPIVDSKDLMNQFEAKVENASDYLMALKKIKYN